MSEEKTTKTETNVVDKVSSFAKMWKYVATGATCAAVTVGVMLGADTEKVQETLNRAQAQQLAIIAATYSAEQVLIKATNIKDTENKSQAIKEVIGQVVVSMPEFIKAATAVKTSVAETKAIVTENKKEVTADKKAEITVTK